MYNYKELPRSELKRIKSEKERLELVKKVGKIDRKFTTVWLISIFTFAILGIIFAFVGFEIISFGMVLGIIPCGVFLYQLKLKIREQMNKIEEIKRLGDQIVEEIKQQETLEKLNKNV